MWLSAAAPAARSPLKVERRIPNCAGMCWSQLYVSQTVATKLFKMSLRSLFLEAAEDRASTEVLAEKPHLDEEKVKWLQTSTAHCRCAVACQWPAQTIWIEEGACCVDVPGESAAGLTKSVTSSPAKEVHFWTKQRLHPPSSTRSRRVAPGPPSEKPETQGAAETAATVSALCYHRSRSAGPHREKAPSQTSQFERVTTP